MLKLLQKPEANGPSYLNEGTWYLCTQQITRAAIYLFISLTGWLWLVVIPLLLLCQHCKDKVQWNNLAHVLIIYINEWINLASAPQLLFYFTDNTDDACL